MSEMDSAASDISLRDSGEGSFSMSDIYYLLLADLSEVSELVDDAKSHANENQPRQSCGAFFKIHKNGHNSTKDLQSALKNKIMESVCKSVEDAKPLGEPLHTGHASLELRAKLLEKVKKDRNSIQYMTSQLSQLQDSNKEISRRTDELLKIIATRATSGEMRTKLKLQEIHQKVLQQRTKLVKDIRYITDQLCPESDIPDILSVAFKESQSEKDPYISVEEVSPEDVEFLLRCNLVSRHPHDRSLIRLRDLI